MVAWLMGSHWRAGRADVLTAQGAVALRRYLQRVKDFSVESVDFDGHALDKPRPLFLCNISYLPADCIFLRVIAFLGIS